MSEEKLDKPRIAEYCSRAERNASHACAIGDCYRLGAQGFPLHPRRAFRWYARSALAGDRNGQNNLGVCFELGYGCRGSMEKAFFWYRRAAERELPTAMSNVGLCYRHGRGGPADEAKAVRWLQRAADAGDDNALKYLQKVPAEKAVPVRPMPRGHTLTIVATGPSPDNGEASRP